MTRKEFIAGLLLALSMRPVWAQPQKIYRIAMVDPFLPVTKLRSDRYWGALLERLRQLGYVEGKNLEVELYSGNANNEYFAELARLVVGRNPDLIYTYGLPMPLQFKTATDKIPVVVSTADPVTFGLAVSLARPGGNFTGVSVDAGLEIWGKRLDLLKEAIPALSKAAFLTSNRQKSPYSATIQEAAQRIGVPLLIFAVDQNSQEVDYRHVFADMLQQHIDAIVLSDDARLLRNGQLIIELATKAKIPAIYPYREQAEVGGLMAYAADILWNIRYAAGQIDQILKGTKPGDIPFYQPTKFELIFNLKAAKEIGVTIPASLLARADEVLE